MAIIMFLLEGEYSFIKIFMEKKWKDALSEGKKVEVDIQIIYDSNSKRPKRFEVKSIIVDKKGIQEIKKYKFYN